MEYEGEKHYLCDTPNANETVFVKDDCLVEIDLSSAEDVNYRTGHA